MDYHALQAELSRYFDELQALAELKGMDRNIAQCLDNAITYIEGALEIAKTKNSQPLGMPYRLLIAAIEPEDALDLILALEDSPKAIKGE